jgi:hypothetical protein
MTGLIDFGAADKLVASFLAVAVGATRCNLAREIHLRVLNEQAKYLHTTRD